MIEQLQNRANTIKGVIRQQPESGIELLLDFARAYSGDSEVEDEVLLVQYELFLDPDLNAERKAEITETLESLTDKVVSGYDKEKVDALVKYELQIAEAAQKRKIEDRIVLVADNIKKEYKSSKFKLEVDHLELRLGQITGLVGENATGKSTLFRILAGDLAQKSGALHYPLFDPKNKLDWKDLKLKIAYVPQELPAWQGSLLENLKFEAALHGILGTDNEREVKYIIQRLGLALHIDKSWKELSGGYKLRFALAKALVWRTQLLILDEPLAFLDLKTQMIVLNDLRDLAKSLSHPLTVIISSQHLHEVEAIADQMLFMRDGMLENLGNTGDIGKDRTWNVFELDCPLSLNDFTRSLHGIAYHKTWSNGMTCFVSTPLDTTGENLLQHLAAQHIKVDYFRDISTSVKTKFYEDLL